MIGEPLVPAGNSVSQITAPDALSNARNFLPASGPAPGGVRTMIGSPSLTKSSVFVSRVIARPGCPSGGRSRCAMAGWFRGPSPLGTIQTCSPVRMSMAVMRPYGGLVSGSPRGPFGNARVPRV